MQSKINADNNIFHFNYRSITLLIVICPNEKNYIEKQSGKYKTVKFIEN